MKRRIANNHAMREKGKRKTTKPSINWKQKAYDAADIVAQYEYQRESDLHVIEALRQSRARLVRLVKAYRLKWIRALVQER